jgi:hypothetical protein
LESRAEGLLLDGICPVHHGKNSATICFMLNKQAELAIAICSIKKKGSEFREFWPMFVVYFGLFTLNLLF